MVVECSVDGPKAMSVPIWVSAIGPGISSMDRAIREAWNVP